MLVETFRSELPSPCTVHLSGKRTCAAVERHHECGSIRQKFATENHSVTIVGRAVNNKAGGEDGYSLLYTRLRPPQRNRRSTNNNYEEKKEEERNNDRSLSRCLAHSMLFCEGMDGMEVFAMEVGRQPENANDTVMDYDNEVATSPIYGVNDGGDVIVTIQHRRQSSVDTTATISNQSLTKNVDNEVADNVTAVGNMKYWLVAKDCTTNDVLATIPLDFRPMLVHLAEIDISTINDGDEEENNDYGGGENNDVPDGRSFSPTAIGIFVTSVDDYTPRLYITTKEAQVRIRRDDVKQSDGSECFVLVSLIDQIDVTHDDNDSSVSEQPLTFSTPIMAMDTIVTDVNLDKCAKKINYLALSCYDGMVRILTYRLIWNNKLPDNADDNISPPRLCPLRCSSFFVDGPVTSLHFSITTVLSDIPLSQQSPSLFLVAGSLCGFACLFYESLQPTRSSNKVGVDRYFNGPVTVVDGLYDGREGGYEDCVTSVHVICHIAEEDRMIAVGTQGGRLLLFAWSEEEKRLFAFIRDEIITAQHEKDEATHRLDQTKKQTSVLQTEKDEMGIKTSNLYVIILELQAKIDGSLNSSTTDNRELVEEVEIQHDNLNSIFNYELKMKAVESELASLQQSMYGHACRIEELSSVMIDLVRQIDEKNDDIARRELQLPQMTRKLHRYTILSESHLPYPIHGIASHVYQEKGGVGRDILVSTRRSFHIFHNDNSFDEGGHNIKCVL